MYGTRAVQHKYKIAKKVNLWQNSEMGGGAIILYLDISKTMSNEI